MESIERSFPATLIFIAPPSVQLPIMKLPEPSFTAIQCEMAEPLRPSIYRLACVKAGSLFAFLKRI